MAGILGLDIGAHSVKAVVLEGNARAAQVKAVLEATLPAEGERLDRVKAALAALLARGPLSVDAVVTAWPGTSLATHAVALPFSDPKKIDSALGFEVESQLPYDVSEVVYDYHVAQAREDGAQLLVGVLRREELAPLLAVLKEQKLDPRTVTHAALAYQGLLAGWPASDEGAVAVLDVGHERTVVAIGRPGKTVEAARVVAGGGAALTKAVAAELSLDPGQAQAWKELYGGLASAVDGPEPERGAAAMARALAPLVREVAATFKSFTARTHQPVTRVLLCGGSAALKGLGEHLAQELKVPVEPLGLPVELTRAAPQGQAASHAQAYALALRGLLGTARGQRFDLRRGEFQYRSDLDYVQDKLGQLAAFAVVLLVLLVASGMVRTAALERREKQVDQVLCDLTQRVLGKCERDYLRALSIMKGVESPAATVPRRTAVTALAELTQRVPEDAPFTFSMVSIDARGMRLNCETSSTKDMENIIAALKKARCFKELQEGKVEKSKDGSKVAFRLDIQLECPDEAGGSEG